MPAIAPLLGEKQTPGQPTKNGAHDSERTARLAPSSQIVEVFRRKLEAGRQHIILQVIDGSSAGYWQHNRRFCEQPGKG